MYKKSPHWRAFSVCCCSTNCRYGLPVRLPSAAGETDCKKPNAKQCKGAWLGNRSGSRLNARMQDNAKTADWIVNAGHNQSSNIYERRCGSVVAASIGVRGQEPKKPVAADVVKQDSQILNAVRKLPIIARADAAPVQVECSDFA